MCIVIVYDVHALPTRSSSSCTHSLIYQPTNLSTRPLQPSHHHRTHDSWQDLKDYFRPIGDVGFTDVDHRSGEGVVEFMYKARCVCAVREGGGCVCVCRVDAGDVRGGEDREQQRSHTHYIHACMYANRRT